LGHTYQFGVFQSLLKRHVKKSHATTMDALPQLR